MKYFDQLILSFLEFLGVKISKEQYICGIIGKQKISSNNDEFLVSPKLNIFTDVLSGNILESGQVFYQCSRCFLFYSAESVKRITNSIKFFCTNCGEEIELDPDNHDFKNGKNYLPPQVDLVNFMRYVRRVVSFEGQVVEIKWSSENDVLVIKFQDASWSDALKIPVFGEKGISDLGGEDFIFSLQGVKIKVRGLLIQHPRFGYEILTHKRSMIELLKS